MSERIELMEAALETHPEGIGLEGEEGVVRLWNPAAEAITGFPAVEIMGRPLPDALETMLQAGSPVSVDLLTEPGRLSNRTTVQVQHKLGHPLPLIVSLRVLRNGLGERIGSSLIFHPAENLDALPHGDAGENQSIQNSQAELEERLGSLFEDFQNGGQPLGALWLTVDQLAGLRKTHGKRACDAALEKIATALMHGLRPAEEIGRWGEDEFLILSHERSADALTAHAKILTGQARTADFRWWGDKISLTISVGAAQAEPGETLAQFLGRAQAAMVSSMHAGGNQITSAPGGQACLPS